MQSRLLSSSIKKLLVCLKLGDPTRSPQSHLHVNIKKLGLTETEKMAFILKFVTSTSVVSPMFVLGHRILSQDKGLDHWQAISTCHFG